MNFIAHVRKETLETHELADHLQATAELAAQFATSKKAVVMTPNFLMLKRKLTTAASARFMRNNN
jgi:hypothetical protein